MTPERFKEIKARCEAATQGPWKRLGHIIMAKLGGERFGKIAHFLYQHSHVVTASQMKRWNDEMIANAAFVINARKDLPDCLDEIERLQQELNLEKANAEMRRKEILLGVKEIVRLQKIVEASKQCCAFECDECDKDIDCKECDSWGYPYAVKKALEHNGTDAGD